jgi:hypothetical protein
VAEQRERIIYEIDSRSVKAFHDQAAKWSEEAGANAARVGESIAASTDKAVTHIASVTNARAAAIQRTVANAEKAARDLGATALERMESRRAFDLGKVAGDPNAIQRVNVAYDQLIKKQKELNGSMSEGLGTLAKQVVSLSLVKKIIEVTAIETAKYAARTQTMGIALNAAARTNHIAALEIQKHETAIKALGITTQGARQGLLRMTTAQLDVAKATELARLAQDAAVISGENSTESFNRLIYAIQSGQPEMLRTIGINVTFEKEYAKLARTLGIQAEKLSENQKVQARLNAVLRAAPLFAGIYEDSMGTVGKQLTSLKRHFEEASNAVGSQFLPAMGAGIGKLTELAIFIKNHPELGLAITSGAGIVGTAIAGGAIGGQIGGAAGGKVGLAVGAGVGTLGVIAAMWPDLQRKFADLIVSLEETSDTFKLVNGTMKGPGFVGPLRRLEERRSATSDELAEKFLPGLSAAARAKQIEVVTAPLFKEATRISQVIDDRREAERIAAEEFAKKQAASAKHLQGVLLDALKAEAEGTFKILERRKELTQEYGNSAANLVKIAEITTSLLRAEGKRVTKEFGKDRTKELDDERNRSLDYESELFSKRLNFAVDLDERERDLDRGVVERRMAAEERAGHARLAQLEGVNRLDLQGLVNLESKKAKIQTDNLAEIYGYKMDLLSMATKREIQAMEDTTRKQFESEVAIIRARVILMDKNSQQAIAAEKEITDKRLANEETIAKARTIITGKHEQNALAAQDEFGSRVDEIRATAIRRQQQLIIDANQRAFDRLRSSAESVFDALLTRSRSFGEALADAIKLPLLTMLKNILSTQTAMLLMRVFGGGGMAGAGAGNSAGGFLGRLAGFGAFGQMAMGGMGGMGGGGMFGIPGAPGGTGGFAGPVGGLGGGTGSIMGGFGGLGGLGILRALGGLGQHTPTMIGGGAGVPFGGFSGLGSQAGVGGALGGGMLAGGGGLIYAGLKRGGWSGLGMTTAGGALMGAKFGGPIGAVIGAAAGFSAGLIRMLFGKAEDKIKEKIRSLYGVTISEKNILRQFAEIAKTQYGGNVDLAINSQQIRDIVELYNMTLGSGRSLGLSNVPRPVSTFQSGNQIFSSPSVSPYVPRAPVSPTIVVQSLALSVNGQSAADALEGRVAPALGSNSRAVVQAVNKAQRSNVGRNRSSQTLLAPNLITT